jgi:signal peptidase II
LVWNDGAAFSLFSNGSTWLGWISLLVSVGLLVWIWRSAPQWSRWQAAAAALLLAGSLGNGLDRWRYGAVIDGLELVPISFPVFNLADVAINFAVLCLLIEAIRQR